MKGSIKLFEIFGISINIHITFLLLPVLFFFMSGLSGVLLVLIVFACVTFHELTHSLVAKKFGIAVKDITLLPIGGVASMSKMPDNPRQEFLISVAGPISNIFLAAVLFGILYCMPWMPKEVLLHPLSGEDLRYTIASLWFINIMLAVFNMLPAFPMDGGRVLRAILALKMSYMKATRIAVGIGHIFAVFFGFWGLMTGNIVLILIALFIYIAASSEETQTNVSETLKTFRVKDVLNTQFLTLERNTPVSKVLELIFHSHQEDFPVMETDHMLGFVTRNDIIIATHQFGPDKHVGDIMRTDIPAVTPEDKLLKVQRIMEEKSVRALPVVTGSRLQGIITLEDIFRIYSLLAR
ncbi:MAG: site-2 protease family protein [Candidatus Omnitrophota bacterium]|nr:site-2 protease family protein [Candidatus Omnitrophota bacterium]